MPAQRGDRNFTGNLSRDGKDINSGLFGGFSLFSRRGSVCPRYPLAPGLPSAGGPPCGCLTRLVFQATNKQRREQQRLEKKQRQEERHRHRALESRSGHRDSNRGEADANTQVTLVKTFAALNI